MTYEIDIREDKTIFVSGSFETQVFVGPSPLAAALAWIADRESGRAPILVHFGVSHLGLTACGIPVQNVGRRTMIWDAVTCDACRLNMPQQKVRGVVEYRTPEHVATMDAALSLADRLTRAASVLRGDVTVCAHGE